MIIEPEEEPALKKKVKTDEEKKEPKGEIIEAKEGEKMEIEPGEEAKQTDSQSKVFLILLFN